jgi:chemotaxis protein CheZ
MLIAGSLEGPSEQSAIMPVQRKVFRIEQMGPVMRSTASPAARPDPQDEILSELQTLRMLLEQRDSSDHCDNRTTGFREFKDEAGAVHDAIARIKQEIGALQVGPFEGGPARATRELDAVAAGTERATEQIITAAEEIEDAASTLAACLEHGQQKALAQDISDQVIRIFEACNFQDLSGQRINKVVETLSFIERRVERMVESWGSLAAFSDDTIAAIVTRGLADDRLQGPKLDGDHGHASQEDVDAMFASD